MSNAHFFFFHFVYFFPPVSPSPHFSFDTSRAITSSRYENNPRFPWNLALKQWIYRSERIYWEGKKSDERGEGTGEILFQPILGKLLRNPHFINKLHNYFPPRTCSRPFCLPFAFQPSGELQSRLTHNANPPTTCQRISFFLFPLPLILTQRDKHVD